MLPPKQTVIGLERFFELSPIYNQIIEFLDDPISLIRKHQVRQTSFYFHRPVAVIYDYTQ